MLSKTAQARAVLVRLSRHFDTSHDLELPPDDLQARMRGARRYWDLAKCLAHAQHYTIYYFPRIGEMNIRQIRCPLKNKCPICMYPDNIVHRRSKDFKVLCGALQALQDEDHCYDTHAWVIQYRSITPLSIKRFSESLKRSDHRRLPLLTGEWAGEAILRDPRGHYIGCNGPSSRAVCVFNGLAAGAKVKLNIDRVKLKYPDSTIQEFTSLLPAWETYLRNWAKEQIEEASPEEVEHWMLNRQRGFQAIGWFRGLRAEMDEAYKSRLHQDKGPAIPLGLCDTTQKAEDVLSHCARILEDKYLALMGEEQSMRDRKKALDSLALQLDHALSREEREEIREHLKRIEGELLVSRAAQVATTRSILAKIDEVRGRDVMDEERAERKPRRPMKQ